MTKPQWSLASSDPDNPKIYIFYGNGSGLPANWVIDWPNHYLFQQERQHARRSHGTVPSCSMV